MHHGAIHNGDEAFDRTDSIGGHFEEIVAQDGEVGELSGGDLSLAVFLTAEPRAALGV